MEYSRYRSENSLFFRIITWLVEKRTLVVALFLVLLLSGVFCYKKLPLEAFPDVANMQVRVITQVPGKASEEVERLVTIPIEKEVNGIPHSKPPRSISIFGLSVVTIVFDDHIEPNSARQQVLERIGHADIPDGLEPELDPNASAVGEIFRYCVQSDTWSSMDRKEVQDWLLNRLFKSVDGIVDATGFGGPTRVFLVEMDPGRFQAYGLDQSDIAAALATSNDSTGGSYITSNDQRYMVRGLGLLKSVDDIGDVVIKTNEEGVPIRVKDVADVRIGEAVRKGQVGIDDDDDAVEGILMMRRGDNPSRVIENLKAVWNDIASDLPEGMRLVVVQDRTALVNRTTETISHNVAEGIVLVVVLLMLFLFQIRSALICSIVIPSALLGACIILRVFDIPANLLSLGAIDFGIIVDGAVIMVENITLRLCNTNPVGSSIKHTVCLAAAEVAKPILFSTTIIAMTFLPILSFEHVEGRLFKPLAIMMILVLSVASFTTIAIIPVIVYIVFRKRSPVHRHNPVVTAVRNQYRRLMIWVQKKSRTTITAVAIFCITGLIIVPFLGAEFIPELEEGNIWLTVTILPASVTLERSVKIAREIREIIGAYPEVQTTLTQVGAPDDGTDPNPYNMIEVLVPLKPQEEWRPELKSKEQLIDAIEEQIDSRIPGLILNFSQCIKDSMEEAMSGVKNGEYAVKISGADIMTLEKIGDQVVDILNDTPGIVDVARDNLSGQPQLVVEIANQQASRYGVTTRQILDVVETSVGGRAVTRIIEGERRFDVILRLHEPYRKTSREVGEILVTAPGGKKIPLQQLARIKLLEGANAILRESNQRRIAVYANIRGRDLGSSVMETQAKIARIKVPRGYHISYAGEFERARQAGERLLIVVPITLLLIFLLLYIAYDSAGTALFIISVVPIAAACAFFVLLISGTHLSISSGVGLIALLGLTIQNAVIITSRTIELFEDLPVRAAIRKAAAEKMNAVFLASLVAAVGLAPAAFSTGIGSQSQKPFAIVIAFGILPATIISFVFLPAIAHIFVRRKKRAYTREDHRLLLASSLEQALGAGANGQKTDPDGNP